MKNTNITITLLMAILLPMATACRSAKHASSSQTTSTTISSSTIDSAAQRLMSTHRKTTRITVLPMQTPGLPPVSTPDAPAPSQDLINQLLQQGGGTIIIEQDEQLQQDQTTVASAASIQDTTTTQNTQYHESQSHQSRASPILDKLLYLFLALAFIILLLQSRNRQ